MEALVSDHPPVSEWLADICSAVICTVSNVLGCGTEHRPKVTHLTHVDDTVGHALALGVPT